MKGGKKEREEPEGQNSVYSHREVDYAQNRQIDKSPKKHRPALIGILSD